AWDSSIREFNLIPSIKFLKTWKKIQKQSIDNIVYNNKNRILIINNNLNQMKYLELGSIENFQCLCSYRLHIDYNETVIQCCLLSYNEWIAIDWKTSKILHITN
ncbi:unnamed protein product, partial [Rotaria sp. Silwood2]